MRVSRHIAWILALALVPACSSKPASIEISPRKVKIYGLDRTQHLTVRVLDKKGRQIPSVSPTWSSSKSAVATVEGGRIVSQAEGKTMVTATVESISAQVPVEVVDVKQIDVTPPSVRLIGPVGTQVNLQATVKDSQDRKLAVPVAWSSGEPKTATVSDSGLVTSVAAGQIMIVARLGDLQGVAEVTVSLRPIARLEIRPATALVRVGDSQHFEVIGYGPDAKPIEGVAAMFHSSNSATAVVDGRGTASGIAAGAATIRATVGGVSAEATLLVN
ncbi:MAG TPA: Ig-like domain-containing protein [Thermoanaerobaculia bacterium]|nr:Ig-like domain-containing protein [Thermoanaerobaculia bacterium]